MAEITDQTKRQTLQKAMSQLKALGAHVTDAGFLHENGEKIIELSVANWVPALPQEATYIDGIRVKIVDLEAPTRGSLRRQMAGERQQPDS